jgi:hypothetical protein
MANQFRNYRGGYLAQGQPMPRVNKSALLSADNQVLNPNDASLVLLSSDNTTATNRTFTILDGAFVGQDLYLNFISGSSNTCDLQSGGNVQLVEAWQPLQYEILHLQWDGTQWCEVCRSETAIVALSIVNADISASAAIAFSKLAALTSAYLLVGSASNVATAVAVTGDVAITNGGVTSIASDVIVNADVNSAAAIAYSKLSLTGSVVSGDLSNTAGALKLAVRNVTAAQLVAAGTGVPSVAGPTVPDNAIVIKAFYEVVTTFAGDGDDTSEISIGIEDQDNDLAAAAAIKTGTDWDATGAVVDCIPADIDDVTKYVKLTEARQIAVTLDIISTDTTLTQGEMNVFVLYIVGG